MFKNKPYGLYKYGYINDLETITAKSLYEYYKTLINNCKIDIFFSGINEKNNIENLVTNNEKIKNIMQRDPKYIINIEKSEIEEVKDITYIQDHMQVNQGKLVIGLKVNSNKSNVKYTTSVYNAILGGGANSKLFQNVREKNGLAYTAGSNYVRQKDTIFIRCGIEISNYQKALETIKEQLEDMKKGNFDENDIENSKNLIIESIKSIPEEQDSEITYYYGQELSDSTTSINEYINKIQQQNKEDIVELAKDININTVYFLRD